MGEAGEKIEFAGGLASEPAPAYRCGMRYLLIANPATGGGKNAERIALARAWFAQRGDAVEARSTEGPEHATRLAREAAAAGGWDAVIAAGGDGTINEVLNGLAGSAMPLGILPWGTGNVFAKEMGFPRSLRRCCRVIRKGRTARLDLGRAGGRRFLMMAGAGIDAFALAQMRGKNWKRVFGVTGYVIGGLFAFARYREARITARFPDGRVERGSYVLVSNTRRYGGIFSIAPDASPVDGRLDVFIHRGTSRWGLVRLVLELAALPRSGPRVKRIVRAAAVELEAEGEVPLQLDGDPVGALPRRIEVEPRALSVILPRKVLKTL